jgi:hypothetical protein
LMQHHVAPLQQQLADTRSQLQQAQQEASANFARSSVAALHTAVPLLPTVVNTPEWRAHLQTLVPMTGETVAAVIQRAHGEGRFDVIGQHVQSVVARRSGANNGVFQQPTAPQTPQPVQQLQQPGLPAPANIPVMPGAGVQPQTVPTAAQGQPVGVSQQALNRLQDDVLAGRVAPDAYQRNLDQLMAAVVSGAPLVN